MEFQLIEISLLDSLVIAFYEALFNLTIINVIKTDELFKNCVIFNNLFHNRNTLLEGVDAFLEAVPANPAPMPDQNPVPDEQIGNYDSKT